MTSDDAEDITPRVTEGTNVPRLEQEKRSRKRPPKPPRWRAPVRTPRLPTVVTEWLQAYRDGTLTYDELKANILARTFDRLPYPLWADHADLAEWGFKPVPGTWGEFIAAYDDGTLSHDEWWGIAGEHPDWAGAPHEEPDSCDPDQGYIVWLRQPRTTERGLQVSASTGGNLYLVEHGPPSPPSDSSEEGLVSPPAPRPRPRSSGRAGWAR